MGLDASSFPCLRRGRLAQGEAGFCCTVLDIEHDLILSLSKDGAVCGNYQRFFGPSMSRKASNVPRATCVTVGLRPWAWRTKWTQLEPVRW